MEIGEIIKNKLLSLNSNIIGNIEIAKPGFINIFISIGYLKDTIFESLERAITLQENQRKSYAV